MPLGGLIAGGLGLAGSLGSSLLQSNAATKASDAQVALGQQALGVQQGLGQQGLQTLLSLFQQARDIAAPTMAAGSDLIKNGANWLSSFLPQVSQSGNALQGAGTNVLASALPTLQALLTPGKDMTATLSQIPGFQFAQDWGQKAVQNLGTTMGLGGNVLKAGADYATGVAQQGFGNIVQYLSNLTGQGINALSNAGNTFSSGAAVGGNVLNTGASTLTQPTNALVSAAAGTGNSAFGGLNTLGQTIGGTLGGIGQSQASGILGAANAWASGIAGGTGSATNALLLSKLFGAGNNNVLNPGQVSGGVYGPGSSSIGYGGLNMPTFGG